MFYGGLRNVTYLMGTEDSQLANSIFIISLKTKHTLIVLLLLLLVVPDTHNT